VRLLRPRLAILGPVAAGVRPHKRLVGAELAGHRHRPELAERACAHSGRYEGRVRAGRRRDLCEQRRCGAVEDGRANELDGAERHCRARGYADELHGGCKR
jgi:hypothetical protein